MTQGTAVRGVLAVAPCQLLWGWEAWIVERRATAATLCA